MGFFRVLIPLFLLTFLSGCSHSVYRSFRYGYNFTAPEGFTVYEHTANLDFLILKQGVSPDSPIDYAGIYVEDQMDNVLPPQEYVSSLLLAINLTTEESEITQNSLLRKGSHDCAILEYCQDLGGKRISTTFFMIFRKHLVYTVIASGSEKEFGALKSAAESVFSSLVIPE